MLRALIEKLKQTEHGFKHIMVAGDALLQDSSLDHFQLAKQLITEVSYQGRMLGVYLLGRLAALEPKAFILLRDQVSKDANWRVQEMLAKAFDDYCRQINYEKALAIIEQWLDNPDTNVKRAVIEGLRIWTSRPYFRDNPQKAIAYISKWKASDSEYLRKSVGNALRDIRKKYPHLINQEIETWDLTNKYIAYTRKLLDK